MNKHGYNVTKKSLLDDNQNKKITHTLIEEIYTLSMKNK